MLENIKSKFFLKMLFSILKPKVMLKIIAYNKSLQAYCSVDINDYKKNAIEYRIKNENGEMEIRSPDNNFLLYKGGFLDGKKNGFGKEYDFIGVKPDEFIKRNFSISKNREIIKNMLQENKNDVIFKNNTFPEESKTFSYYYKGEEYFCFINSYYEGYFEKGRKMNGKIKEYDAFGNIKFEGEYINGNKRGQEYEDGRLIFEGEYTRDGEFEEKTNGKIKHYNRDGKLVFEGELISRVKHGKEYDKNGDLIFEGEYKSIFWWKGKGKEYDFFGNLVFEGEYVNGEKVRGIFRRYTFEKFGKKILEIEFKNGEGEGKEYDLYGNIIYEGNYIIKSLVKTKNKLFEIKYLSEERWNGKENHYDTNGNLIFEGGYINGVRHGKEYDNKGNIVFEGEYFKMKRFNGIEKKYYDNGNLKYEGEYILGKRKGKAYNEDGNIISLEYLNEKTKIEIMCDSLNDNYKENYKGKEYDIHNNLIFEGEFELGKRIKGKRKIYDNNSNLLFEFDYDKNLNASIDKKDILFQIESTYEKYNGLKVEKGKEINFKDKYIFIGEFINGVKSNGVIKVYNNLKIDKDEDTDTDDLKIEKNNSIILISDIVIKNEEIMKKTYFYENKIVLIYEYKYEKIWKEKYYNDNQIVFESEFINGKKFGKLYNNKLRRLEFEGEYKYEKIWDEKDKKFFTNKIKLEEINKNLLRGKQYMSSDGKFKYDGEFKNAKKNGKGKEYDFNGILIFDGEFKDDKRDGKGIVFNKNKKIFEGIYKDDKKNGKGVDFDLNNNIIFKGEYAENKKWNGKEYFYKGIYKFEQEYKNGEKIGKIIMKEYFKNKLNFVGESLNFEKNGNGKEYFKDKLIFEGEYLNGKRNGFGKEYNFEGGKFIGIFRNGKKWDGTGFDKNNNIDYEIINGHGIIKEYYKGKLIYEGQFSNGKRHGIGKQYDFLTGKLKHEGRFEYGTFFE